MFILVLSMDVLGVFLIPCRSQWRTSFCQVRTMHVEHQMEKHGPPEKAEIANLGGHCRIGNVLPNIVKLLNIYRRLTRQKMRMDNLSLGRKRSCTFGEKVVRHWLLHGISKAFRSVSGYRIGRALNDSYR